MTAIVMIASFEEADAPVLIKGDFASASKRLKKASRQFEILSGIGVLSMEIETGLRAHIDGEEVEVCAVLGKDWFVQLQIMDPVGVGKCELIHVSVIEAIADGAVPYGWHPVETSGGRVFANYDVPDEDLVAVGIKAKK